MLHHSMLAAAPLWPVIGVYSTRSSRSTHNLPSNDGLLLNPDKRSFQSQNLCITTLVARKVWMLGGAVEDIIRDSG